MDLAVYGAEHSVKLNAASSWQIIDFNTHIQKNELLQKSNKQL